MRTSLLSLLLPVTLLACTGGGKGDDDDGDDAVDGDGDGIDASEDCDDSDPAVFPGAVEVCDGIDNDCDDLIDDDDDSLDAATAADWYADGDGDGFGSDGDTAQACVVPEGFVDRAGDCDDTRADVNPDAQEICDDEDVDEDCSGEADDADAGVDPATMAVTAYADVDGDGYGDLGAPGVAACDLPSGASLDNTDCDDDDPLVNPGAQEVCDDLDVDEDCSGAADDADAGVDPGSFMTFYPDADGDGFGDAADAGSAACDASSGMVADNTDCDDDDGLINPDASEVCDGLDNDCDATTTESGLATFTDASGVESDFTASLSGSVVLSTDGMLAVCDGTWSANLEIAADVDIINPSGVPSDVVIDGGAAGSVVLVGTAGISASIEGVTLQNGAGSGDAVADLFPGANGGGVDCSAAGATLSLSTVDIIDNTALSGVGGGLASSGCDVFIDDAVISGNEAEFAGGLYVDAGTLTVSESVVSDNIANDDAGGVMVFDYTGAAVLSLDEVEVTGNTAADDGGGLGAWEIGAGTTISCVGSTSTDAGFTDNSAADGGGVYLYAGVDLTSTDCDFGTSAGGDDNTPDDLFQSTGAVSFMLGSDETFTCVDGICGTDLSTTAGSTGSTGAFPASAFGNVVLATVDSQLYSFGMSASSVSGSTCTADFYLMSNSSESKSGWTVEWASLGNTISTATSYESGGFTGAELTAGTYYALIFGTTCASYDLNIGYGSGITDADAGIGTITGYVFDNGGYTSTHSVGDVVDFGFFSISFAFDVSVDAREL